MITYPNIYQHPQYHKASLRTIAYDKTCPINGNKKQEFSRKYLCLYDFVQYYASWTLSEKKHSITKIEGTRPNCS
jgi:hypothetical protein